MSRRMNFEVLNLEFYCYDSITLMQVTFGFTSDLLKPDFEASAWPGCNCVFRHCRQKHLLRKMLTTFTEVVITVSYLCYMLRNNPVLRGCTVAVSPKQKQIRTLIFF